MVADVSSSTGPEVLLHTASRLLETTTSNIAFHLPGPDLAQAAWVTPKLDRETSPFLNGVMRRHLLEEGVIREGEVSVEDWERVKSGKGRVIGFNGLRQESFTVEREATADPLTRGVWEADPQ